MKRLYRTSRSAPAMKRQIGAELTGATIHAATASSVKVHVSMNPRRRRATESYFHCRKAVASLKDDSCGFNGELIVEFPLPKGGGLIEGICSRLESGRCRRVFPLPKGGGLIEGPKDGRNLLTDRDTFPLPKGGGLIEGPMSRRGPVWRPQISIAERRWPH